MLAMRVEMLMRPLHARPAGAIGKQDFRVWATGEVWAC